MKLVVRLGGEELDVVAEASPGATVGELVEALAGGPVGGGVDLVVGARALDGNEPLSTVGIRQGAVVRLGAAAAARGDGHQPLVEVRVVGGLRAGGRTVLGAGRWVLGRGGDVVLDDDTVSFRHARLDVGAHGRCLVHDLGSRNGTRLDGCFLAGPQVVGPGQLLELGATQVRVLPLAPAADAAPPPPAVASGTTAFNRPPRRAAPPGPAPIVPPIAAPDPVPVARPGWATLVAPLVLGAAMAALFEPVFAVFALFGPVMLLAGWWEDRRRVARERAAGRRRLDADLEGFRASLGGAASAEAERRRAALPDPAETVRRAELPATTLWERRRDHADALLLSLGTADVPWPPPLAGEGPGAPEVEAAVAEVAALPRTPVPLDLRPPRVVGVAGPRPAALALARSLVCQAAVHHGPADVRIVVLTDAAGAGDWDWAKWLPHTAGARAARPEDSDALARTLLAPAATDPVPFAVVDADGLLEARHAPVRELLASGAAAGIVVAGAVERLPALCTTVVELEGPDGAGRVVEPSTGGVIEGLLAGGVGAETARRCARSLAGLDDPEAGAAATHLPARVPLFELAPFAGPPTPDELRARWRASPAARSLTAVVGVHEDAPFVVDLVADGPHALAAGTTGAGKSELLRTLVASLAATHGPDRLNFVLVDYKGGSAFGPCRGLPHVVGLVTDLDEQLGERALRSLEAELRHREEVLRRAGAADLAAYVAGHGEGSEAGDALARLVVVVDEFATMAAELPDFVDSLVGIAQRGRSLGVHLVLATQRPAGAVSDNIRANTNLRIALRVQDAPDSVDVVGVPDAAALDRHRPGRGYVRRGHGEVEVFQAALVSAVSARRGAAPVRVRPFCFADAGPADGGDGAHADDTQCDLSRLVAAAVAAARASGQPPPRRPWVEPLPPAVRLADLPPGCVGLADEPDRQRQVPYRWEPAAGNLLLYGVAGSGATAALAALALALAAGGPASHLYVVDFGNGVLGPLAGLAAVGAVVTAGERERQERLVRMLRAELERRRRAGSGAGEPRVVLLVDNVGGFWASFDDVAGLPVLDDVLRLLADAPSLGMVVAGTADRPAAVPSSWASLVPERLVLRLADPYDATAFGLSPHHLPRPVTGRAVHVPTGREVQLATPSLDAAEDLAEAVAAIGAAGAGADGGPAPVGVLPEKVALEDVVGQAGVDGDEWFLPVGMGDTALSPVGLRLGEGDHALVAGPSRSGRSTALCAVAATAAGRPDVTVWAVALRRSPLRRAPGATHVATDTDGLAGVLADLAATPGPHLLLIDDADVVDDPGGALAALLAARRPDLHVVAAGRADALRSAYGHWTTEVRRSRQGLALRPHLELDGDLWHTVLPRRGPNRFPPGRGYLVCEGAAELVQVAAPRGALGTTAGLATP